MLAFLPFHLATLHLILAPSYSGAAATGGGGGGGSFIYNGFAGANLTLDGVAAVTVGGLLVLTNGSLQTKGHAFHPSPLPFWDPGSRRNATAARSFSTTFVFTI